MKALILNSATSSDSFTSCVFEIVADELNKQGWDVETIPLRDVNISNCRSCSGSWVKTEDSCAVDNSADGLIRAWMETDLLIILTKVTFGGYSSALKKAIDRMIPTASPFFMKVEGESHHKPRSKTNPRLFAIGVMVQPSDAQKDIFFELVKKNAINWHNPSYAALIITTKDREEDIRAKIREVMPGPGGRQ